MIDDSRLMIADMRSGAAAAEPRSRCGQNRVKTWFKSAFVRHHKSSIINHKSIVILGCLLAAPSLAAPASTNLADLNELKLDSAVEIALETNPSLGAAAARVTQARARLRQARSRYWPSVTGAGSAMHVDAADEMGAVLAAFLIGFAQILTVVYWGAHYQMVVALLAIILTLIVRPSGLFGRQKELEERV